METTSVYSLSRGSFKHGFSDWFCSNQTQEAVGDVDEIDKVDGKDGRYEDQVRDEC